MISPCSPALFGLFSPLQGKSPNSLERIFDSTLGCEIDTFSPFSTTFLEPRNVILTQKLEIPQRPCPILLAPPKKAKKEPQILVPSHNDRDWKSTPSLFTFLIGTKTRCEAPSPQVPETLYSSLKYEIKQRICASSVNEKFIMGRISVVDSRGSEVEKNLLRGVVECALTKQDAGDYEGTMKVQFVDCSYHHKKGDFSWRIQYFVPSDLETPILSLVSAPFKVFARKPTVKKRKSTNFDDFTSRLEELVKAGNKLKSNEKKVALEMVTNKFKSIDPDF